MVTRVIIADDHKILRDGLRTVLEDDTGFEVVGESDNGWDTVRLVKQLAPDVVIMDVAMPDLNGIDATRQIRDAGVGAKVLALSMHSDSRFVKGMLQAGACGYMLKDCAAEELGTAIRAVLDDELYLGPGVEPPTIRR